MVYSAPANLFLASGSDDELEKNLVLANEACSAFFELMKKSKEQALLSAPIEFQVCKGAECPITHTLNFGGSSICTTAAPFHLLAAAGNNQAQVWRKRAVQHHSQVRRCRRTSTADLHLYLHWRVCPCRAHDGR